jgi:Cd2+/Zn2+-exporting ATPase
MGAGRKRVALKTAGVALIADDLTRQSAALRLARKALTNIRQTSSCRSRRSPSSFRRPCSATLLLTSGLLLNEGAALLIIANPLRLLRASKA